MSDLGLLSVSCIAETMSASWVTWKMTSSSSSARSVGSLSGAVSGQGGEDAMQWTGRLLCRHSGGARWCDAKWWKVWGSVGRIGVVERQVVKPVKCWKQWHRERLVVRQQYQTQCRENTNRLPYYGCTCTRPVAVGLLLTWLDGRWTGEPYPSSDRWLYSHTRSTVRCAPLATVTANVENNDDTKLMTISDCSPVYTHAPQCIVARSCHHHIWFSRLFNTSLLLSISDMSARCIILVVVRELGICLNMSLILD